MNNILILSAGRRVELINSFKQEIDKRDLKSKVFATDVKPGLSAACQIANQYFKSPKATDSGYIEFLYTLCKEEKVTQQIFCKNDSIGSKS